MQSLENDQNHSNRKRDRNFTNLVLKTDHEHEKELNYPTSDQNGNDANFIPATTVILDSDQGLHFLTDERNRMLNISPVTQDEDLSNDRREDNCSMFVARSKHELLEYMMKEDGSVVCKMCGEILASRTHWYRHKYKLHVPNSVQPAALFKCEKCCVFFKSRKGE